MRNPRFKSLLCLCAYWLLCGAEAKCVLLEFPEAENHRFTAPEAKWLNFSFNVREEDCLIAKNFQVVVYRENWLLCSLEIFENGSCLASSREHCGCSDRIHQFTFSKKMEAEDAVQWSWSVRYPTPLDTFDVCFVTFALPSSREVNDNSPNCRNRLPRTHSIITSPSSPELNPRVQIEDTSRDQTTVSRDGGQVVRQPEVGPAIPIIPILLAVVAGLVVFAIVSFMCWKRKTKAVFQVPDYSSSPLINNSLAIRNLPRTPSAHNVNSLPNEAHSKRVLNAASDQSKNGHVKEQVQETNAPANEGFEVCCSGDPVLLDASTKMSCSAVDMKLVMYVKGWPINPETPSVVSPSADPEYLSPCCSMYVTMEKTKKRNPPDTYQNVPSGERYMSMSPPRYHTMPMSSADNEGVSEGMSSDPETNSSISSYSMNEEKGNTTFLHLNGRTADEMKFTEVSEFEKKIAEVSEYSVIS